MSTATTTATTETLAACEDGAAAASGALLAAGLCLPSGTWWGLSGLPVTRCADRPPVLPLAIPPVLCRRRRGEQCHVGMRKSETHLVCGAVLSQWKRLEDLHKKSCWGRRNKDGHKCAGAGWIGLGGGTSHPHLWWGDGQWSVLSQSSCAPAADCFLYVPPHQPPGPRVDAAPAAAGSPCMWSSAWPAD